MDSFLIHIGDLLQTLYSAIIYSMSELYSEASRERRMKYTPEERSERARLMARARWDKVPKKKRVEFVKNTLVKNQGRFKKTKATKK